MADISAFQKYRPHTPAILLTMVFTASFLLITLHLAFNIYHVVGWYDDKRIVGDLHELLTYLYDGQKNEFYRYKFFQYISSPNIILKRISTDLHHYALLEPVVLRATSILLGCLFGSTYIYLATIKATDLRDGLLHVAGRYPVFHKAEKVFTKNESKIEKRQKNTLYLAPNAQLSRMNEAQHILAVGSTGSGKTQIIKFWLDQLLSKNVPVLIHDTKGDLTSELPASRFVFLAPHDSRTHGWDIARDCIGPGSARELAAALIPETQDPVWSNGTRELFAGIIIYLQTAYDYEWGWKNITDIAYSSPQSLKDILSESYPQAAQYIILDENTGAPNRTSFSFLVGLWSAVGKTVSPLAEAWSDIPEKYSISITEWVKDGAYPIIMQRSAQYPELSAAWMQALISLLSNFACSSALPDSRSRRVWLVLDELAQIKKIAGFQQILETGRSKGICSIIAVQDLEQLSSIYGEKELKSWLNIIGTKIIGRMNAGPSAQYISQEVIGTRRVGWYDESYSSANNSAIDFSNNSSANPTKNSQFRTETIPTISPSDLERDYGLINVGGSKKIRSIVLKHGNAYQMNWPITHWPKLRTSVSPAAWTGVE